MEWLSDPNIWVGFLTLVVLEIVLGIDNLIFIAILAEKLPPHQRDKARLLGLGLAMLMRLGLLTMISWIVSLTEPLFTMGSLSFSGRDLILLLGGLFLLFKATVELHERVEGKTHAQAGPVEFAAFGVVVAQIIALDAVFSLDSVITAVGMVDELGVMMAAVVVSMGVMLFASKPLTRFVNAHPTVVVLCLSFLLMIGLSLIAEGFGFHIPKSYLYAAIGFSVLIEALNQLAHRNFAKHQSHLPLRERTADAVLRLLGATPGAAAGGTADAKDALQEDAFEPEERNMVSGVLSLSQRSIRSIMTNRSDISWIDLEADAATIRTQLLDTPHGFFPVCRGELDDIVGVARAKDLMADLTHAGQVDPAHVRPPIIVPDASGVLQVMDTLKRSHGQVVLIADEYGTIQGLVTPIDILEAIAGEFPDEDELPVVRVEGQDRWRVDGSADLHYLEQVLGTDALVSENDDYTSLAGFMLERFGTLPEVGQAVELDKLRFEVAEVLDRRIATVLVTRSAPAVRQARGA
ncbi:TerC family protein [Massilia sp. YIM B02769]|uniref:TerC family protein n=1 Tax=Massilia sp. YIM B02769 TaxID=3050129 RepID=UPI0025B71690|nr:TerC family protein [Massilia sp. YIM B02769]MDN4059041.1 TerC family protein [Massilia sp. YIM B02769]